ncbi:hypothetical protein NRIC_29310 [Enterococcus florum]|uniref:Uncharacterized protein n=1 Tax=Enterococcus florum TaxID=2480627 RepID=A0A4P5PAP3_9ENTE|nr:hypothetical protein [Enterococcus florum]GCF95040.1 hypothetical protein NRIC_29310 [Enterococcus florum]
MDTALVLKKRYREGLASSFLDAKHLLETSTIVQTLLSETYRTDTFTGLRKLEYLLIELSEIPFTYHLEPTKKMLSDLVHFTKQEEGFSLTGTIDGVLACHHAMITLIMIRFGEEKWAKHGIDWILRYQITSRDEPCHWKGTALFERFGGCIGRTPCYDGLVKAMTALSEYQSIYGKTEEISGKLGQGIESILDHRVFCHRNSTEPIHSDMTKLFYPYPYRTNLIETLKLSQFHNSLL